MIIRLDVKVATFTSYLVKLGYNHKIIQYATMIDSIKRKVSKDLHKAYENKTLTTTGRKIFKGIIPPSIYILENKNFCDSIDSEYLKEIIDDGILDIFFDVPSTNFKYETQEKAYKIKVLKSITFKNNIIKDKLFNKYSQLIGNKAKNTMPALKCLASNGIHLTEEEKNEIKMEINSTLSNILLDKDIKVLTMTGRINLSQLNTSKYNSTDFLQFLKDNLFDDYILDKDIYAVNNRFTKVRGNELEVYQLRDHLRNVTGTQMEHVVRMMNTIHNGDSSYLMSHKGKPNTQHFADSLIDIERLKLVDINLKKEAISFGDKTFEFSYKDFMDYVER